MEEADPEPPSIEVSVSPPNLSVGVRTRLQESRGESDLASGGQIRHYELIRKIGEGGMGVVFLARDQKLGRRVALKFVTAPTLETAQRFVSEARMTATCHHENIVIVYEVDAHKGTPYMVLEYVEGRTLREEIGPKRIPAARAIELIVPVVKALICAHGHGIVHRDLKMGNILVASNGVIKVVDFGVAKVLHDNPGLGLGSASPAPPGTGADRATPSQDEATVRFPEGSVNSTQQGMQIGTPAYMAPEQFAAGPIDHRADLWAVGIILYRMVTGRHPVTNPSTAALMFAAGDLDTPHDSVRSLAPKLAEPLVQIIDRCLEKRVERRWPDAAALLAALEPLMPSYRGRALATGECPFPGLSAFQEADANRFFGRRRDTLRAVTRLRERPLVGVVGPSGVGKSSFVRAGIIPALKATEPWTVLTLRPGRSLLATLAAQLRELGSTVPTDLEPRLRAEPGLLGSLLRAHARRTGTKVLLFIDQFEELYTLVLDPAERLATTAALAGVADDPDSPVRVVVSLRSDFIDRVDEDRRFSDELVHGIVLLSAPTRDDLHEVLVQPLAMVGHRFEDDAIVDDMIATLDATAGALPLLQFTASRLWDVRDAQARTLTRAAYLQIGGVAGALATHADDVIARLAAPQQRLAQLIFQRLVTTERTRAVVDSRELEQLALDARTVRQLVEYFTAERLVVVQTRGAEGATVEIVHESLIASWPTLRRWLDDSHEDTVFVAQLAVAAKQWSDHGRSGGLLWRGEAAEEARRWRRRSEHVLGPREHEYLNAVLALADRSVRIRRGLVIGTISFLGLLVAAGAIALVSIRQAEQRAAEQASVARSEADKARAAEVRVVEQLELVRAKERERMEAVTVAEQAGAVITGTKEELKATNQKLVKALEVAQAKSDLATRESANARAESTRAQAAAEKLEVALARERARIKDLERERARITKELR